MKKGIRKKAFTLTELLVVVVVIGVLSAVVLPKFSKVIETRRTTEAEELMASIRTEQERRCALDKKYITNDITRLNDIVKNPNTKNYTLELASTGIKANRKENYKYTLHMPSYADGRICCSGDDCEKLNKNYPNCEDLKNKSKTPDYQESPASCAGEVSACEKDPNSCECNPNQAKCCPTGTVWNGSSCVTPEPPCNDCSCPEYAQSHQTECNPEPEPTDPKCSDEHHEGEPTTEWSFNPGAGFTGVLRAAPSSGVSGTAAVGGPVSGLEVTVNPCSLGECAVTGWYWHCGADTDYQWEKQKKTNCEPQPNQTKPCEDKGNRKASGNQTAKYTCGSNGWTLNGWDTSACRYACDPAAKPKEDPNKKMKCNYCGEAVIQYECDDTTGNWKEVGGPCNKTKDECGYWCGTSKAECKPGAHDYKSGKECAPGKGHPGVLVTRYGDACTFSNGYMCYMKSSSQTDLAITEPGGGSSNAKRECECPSAFWSGRYCDERCRWVTENCAPSSGGGGGGGGGRTGGCSTSIEVFSYYRDATGQYHETYAYVTRCD